MANRLGMYKMTKVTRNGRPEWEQQKSNLTGNTLAKSKTNTLYFDCNGYWFIWPEEKKDLGGFQLRQKGKNIFSFEHPYSYDKHLPQAKLGSLLALLLGSIGKEGRPMSWSSQSRFSFQEKKLNLCSSTFINIQVVEGSCESKECPSQQTCHDLWGGVACYTYWVPFPFGCFINNAKHALSSDKNTTSMQRLSIKIKMIDSQNDLVAEELRSLNSLRFCWAMFWEGVQNKTFAIWGERGCLSCNQVFLRPVYKGVLKYYFYHGFPSHPGHQRHFGHSGLI